MMTASSKVTFEAPREIRRVMDAHPEVNWSEVFRQAVLQHARALDIARRIAEEMNDPRVVKFAARLKRGVGERARRAWNAGRG
jgi:hypothetical protein